MISTFKPYRKGWWVRVDEQWRKVAAGSARIAIHIVLQNLENSGKLGKSGVLELEWLQLRKDEIATWNAERAVQHSAWKAGQRPHPDIWTAPPEPA